MAKERKSIQQLRKRKSVLADTGCNVTSLNSHQLSCDEWWVRERIRERVLVCKSKNCIWCEPYLFWTCHPRAPFLFLICHGSSICQFHVSFHLPFLISFKCYFFSFSPSTSIFHPSASFDWSSVASSLEHSPRQHLSQLNQPPLLRHEKWLFDTFSRLPESSAHFQVCEIVLTGR